MTSLSNIPSLSTAAFDNFGYCLSVEILLVIARYKLEGLGDNWAEYMKIVPVNFNKEHKAMLGHCKMILEDERGKIAINPDRFDKLITSLRTAVDIDGTLDKEATSYNDIFDAFRLALKFYHYRDSSDYD